MGGGFLQDHGFKIGQFRTFPPVQWVLFQFLLSSEKSTKKEQNEEVRYASREFSYQSFSRTFTLQKEVVDTENIQAKYEDGVLHLLIPKKEQTKQKPPKQIEIL